MTNLTREETVWLEIYTELKKLGHIGAEHEANTAVIKFNNRFPVSTLPQKESVSWVAPDECNHRLIRSSCILCPPVEADKPKGVYITRESLAKAWNERVWQPHQQGGIGSTLRSEAFKLFCKDLGLSE